MSGERNILASSVPYDPTASGIGVRDVQRAIDTLDSYADSLASQVTAVQDDIDAHELLTEAHGATGAVVGTTNLQTLSNKTLTTPIIGSFASAQHDHGSAAKGGALANDLVTYAMLQNIASANRFLGSVGAAADAVELTAVQAVANLVTGLGIHYACYYGGAVTLATGSDTVIALGTTQLASGTFSIASNVITVANAQVAMLVFFSVMLEGTVSGQAQSWIELHEDPNTGSFAAVTGTRKEGCVDAANTALDRVTICHAFIVMPGASYKYKLVGQIRSGSATVKTVAAGSSIVLMGISNA